jgi:hypothetical protein
VAGDLSLVDLYGKKVAVVSGYVWHEQLVADHPAIEVVPVQNLGVALNMVSFGSDMIGAWKRRTNITGTRRRRPPAPPPVPVAW